MYENTSNFITKPVAEAWAKVVAINYFRYYLELNTSEVLQREAFFRNCTSKHVLRGVGGMTTL